MEPLTQSGRFVHRYSNKGWVLNANAYLESLSLQLSHIHMVQATMVEYPHDPWTWDNMLGADDLWIKTYCVSETGVAVKRPTDMETWDEWIHRPTHSRDWLTDGKNPEVNPFSDWANTPLIYRWGGAATLAKRPGARWR